MARPSTVFTWAAFAATYRAAIPAAIRLLGFIPFTRAIARYVNQALFEIGEWVTFLAAFTPQDREIDVGRITGNGDPDGSGRGLVITTDGTGTGILIAPPSGDALSMTTTGAADITLASTRDLEATSSSATGAMTFGTVVGSDRTGIRVDHANRRLRIDGGVGANAAGLRYPYQASDGLEVTIPMWPGLGGWMQIPTSGTNISDTGWAIITSQFVVENFSAGTLDIDFRAPIPGIVGNAEASGTVYQLTAITSSWGAGGVVDPDVEIVERDRATYAESVIATVNTATPTWAGTANLTPTTHDYYARLVASIPVSGSNRTKGLNVLILTINKFAVE